jgi:transposase
MKRDPRKGQRLPSQLAAVTLHAAGIAIGAQEHWVAVPPDSDPQPVRRFGACTADLEAIATWLQQCSVMTVAMESTGVYWIPLFELLFRATGVDLTAIEGINEHTALGLLSEIGTDMTRWSTEKQFAAWLGLCPQHKISGGKVLSRKVRLSANRAATALRLAATCLHHSHSALGAFFRRLKARLGTPKAVVATAHKLARLV